MSNVRHLLYPCPEENVYGYLIYPFAFPALTDRRRRSLSGLGTHLTMDMDGEIRFGPDVEWLEPPLDEEGEDVPDFWEKRLAVTDERMAMAIEEVTKFLPGVKADGFAPDCASCSHSRSPGARTDRATLADSGIRPKLSKKGETAVDFSITHPRPGFISLQGIESPGLTSSLAIAERVEAMVREEVHGLGRGRGQNVSERGRLDSWA